MKPDVPTGEAGEGSSDASGEEHLNGKSSPLSGDADGIATTVAVDGLPTATRKDIQIGRRLFHLANGVSVATAYALLFTHTQIVYLFGTIACLVYIADRIRIHYPELVQRVPWVNERFFRAEEQFREAAMTPYAIAILLTLITFPKPIALIGIYTLGIADPFVGDRRHQVGTPAHRFGADRRGIARVLRRDGGRGRGRAHVGSARADRVAGRARLGERSHRLARRSVRDPADPHRRQSHDSARGRLQRVGRVRAPRRAV
jgi:hypothetical protein